MVPFEKIFSDNYRDINNLKEEREGKKGGGEEGKIGREKKKAI